MRKIFIINQYSSNKGDRAVLFALKNLLRKYKDIEIVVSTSNLSDWNHTFDDTNIRFVPWGWDYHPQNENIFIKLKFFLLRRIIKLTYALVRKTLINDKASIFIKHIINPDFYNALQDADLVISTGGHHITTILAKNAVSSQVFDIASALILKKKVVLWSQTIGPLDFDNVEDKIFVDKIINNVDLIYVRDKKSLEVLKDAHCNSEKIVPTFETVLSLNNTIPEYLSYDKRKKIIGISIYSTVNRNESELQQYINAMSGFVNYCIGNSDNDIVFLPMELKGSGPDDRWLINKIYEKILIQSRCKIMDEDLTTEVHFDFIKNCRYFVGHKTHSVIFALAAGTPLLAIAYHPKTIEFMNQYDNGDYAVSDINLTEEILIDVFKKIELNADNIGNKIFSQSRVFAQKIETDFDEMIKSYL